MAIAEILLGAFITLLFEKLASSDLIKLAQSAGVYSEINKWRNTLTQIQAVIVDAGQKHLRDGAIQLWLNKLHHLAYDIDDVLDDLATEAMRRQLNQQPHGCTSKVLKFIPTKFHAVKYGCKMSSKLDKITSQLHALVEEKNVLGLISNVETTSRPRSEETSLVVESEIVGREGDKTALLEKLLGNESCDQNFSIVSIVGLGGIGKTTLARLLYNEKEVKDHFELTSWVCVSDDFKVSDISKAIFIDVGGVDNGKLKTLNQIQVALSEKLANKRFLIVLDDVWNEDVDEWKRLQLPFVKGAPGSKVIVTTRKTMVASVMDSITPYPLELLSNDDALSLFAHHASGKQNFDSDPTLKSHGESIVKKCGGLPLALTTIGRVLRRKTKEEWEELVNSEIWSVQNEGNILPALKLSYYDLPPHLKQMFAYCCLFPKDYLFEKDELVLLWMAEGFLLKSHRYKSMESFGRDCFEELESRSFFQHSTNDKSQFTMHDLISDLAMSVAGEFFFMLDDKFDVYDKNVSLEKFHHFSFIRQPYGVYRNFKALERARRLRTFLSLPVTRLHTWEKDYISNKVLTELVPQLKFLRVLNLTNFEITEVPQSIVNLKHMRYLNFCNTDITCLPEQIGDLYNLQSLLLSGCHELSSLPDSCGKLINLRHLDISDTRKLNEMPLGIGRLTSLQTLSKVNIGGASGFNISDLEDLLHLQGRISIIGLRKVTYAAHAKKAKLLEKKGLCDLVLAWSDVFYDARNPILQYEVLEALRPSEKMTSLRILYYMGVKFPSWLGDSSFVYLTELTLRGCHSCTNVPTLGHLPSLKKLFLERMNRLKIVGEELLGPADSCNGIAFPSLEVLGFKYMEGWEKWSARCADKDGIVGLFPCLREIIIDDCPKLDVVEIDLIPSLKVLVTKGCSVAVLRSMVCASSSLVRLTVENIKGLSQLNGEILGRLQKVESLNISECDELTRLCESEVEPSDILVSLQQLEVNGCANLVSLVERRVVRGMGSEVEASDIFVSLQKLKVSGCANLVSLVERRVVRGMGCIRDVEIICCPKLESYNCPSSIEMLRISECGSMTSLSFPQIMNDLPSNLKTICLWNSVNLEVNWVFNNMLSSLGSLTLFNMSNVRLLPEECLVHLTALSVSGCDNLEFIPKKGYGFLPHPCLRSLTICSCKNIKSFPYEDLESLTSLEYMKINYCGTMDKAFPSGKWPPNLIWLTIGVLKKPMREWRMQNFPTSLVTLQLTGKASGVVTFAAEEDVSSNNTSSSSSSSSSFLLPSSLKILNIAGFDELESVRKGMQHLTSLEKLYIWDCPKLRDLPETLLPSLSCLHMIQPSEELKKKCRRRKGKYWPIISQIPALETGSESEIQSESD